MKKNILLFLITLIFTSFNNDDTSDFNIVGKWRGVENEETSHFIFDKEGFAYFDFKGLKIGGKEFTLKGKKASMRYEIDDSSSPMKIDFIVTIIDEDKTKRLLCIAKIIDNDKLLFAVGFNGERPTVFEGNNEMIFNRVKE